MFLFCSTCFCSDKEKTGHIVTPKQQVVKCVKVVLSFFLLCLFHLYTLPEWFQAHVWSYRNGHAVISSHVPAVHHLTLEQMALHLVNFSLCLTVLVFVWIEPLQFLLVYYKSVHQHSNFDSLRLKTVSPKVTSLLFSQILVLFVTSPSPQCLILPNVLTHHCDFQFCTTGTWRSVQQKQH